MPPSSYQSAHQHPLEKRLAHHISSLLPSFPTGFINFAWLLQAQSVLVTVLTDLDTLTLEQQQLTCMRKDEKLVGSFLEECVRALDVCNAIKHGVTEATKLSMQVKLAVEILDVREQGRYSEARLRRAKKVLGDYREHGSGAVSRKEAAEDFVKVYSGDELDCIHENHILRTAGVAAGRHLRAITGKLLGKEKTPLSKSFGGIGRDELLIKTSSCNMGAIYGTKLVTVFLLSTILASVTGKRGYLFTFHNMAEQYDWSSVLQSLQAQVTTEMHKRSKRVGHKCVIWEVEQLNVCVTHICDLVHCLLKLQRFPLLEVQEEEMKKATLQLKRQQEAIERGFEEMDMQISQVYKHLISTRTKITNMSMAQL